MTAHRGAPQTLDSRATADLGLHRLNADNPRLSVALQPFAITAERIR
jgi:hypothetical protein